MDYWKHHGEFYRGVRGVHGGHRLEANEKLIERTCQDAKCLTSDWAFPILGELNGHVSDLDGYTDVNVGKQLAPSRHPQSKTATVGERVSSDAANIFLGAF